MVLLVLKVAALAAPPQGPVASRQCCKSRSLNASRRFECVVFIFLYMHICVRVYIYIYLYIYIIIYYMYICICIYVGTHDMCVCIYIYMHWSSVPGWSKALRSRWFSLIRLALDALQFIQPGKPVAFDSGPL